MPVLRSPVKVRLGAPAMPRGTLNLSEEVQASVASSHAKVLSVVPFSVMPPPSANASVGDVVAPMTMFLSATSKVTEEIVVVAPSTSRLPLMRTRPVSLPMAAGSMTKIAGPRN